MLIDVFESKYIKNALETSVKKHAHEADAQKIISDIMGRKLDNTVFVKQIAEILRRYFTTQRTISALLMFSDNLKKLIDVQITPLILEVSEGETVKLMVFVENNSGLGSSFKVSLSQKRKESPIVYNPIKSFNEDSREIKQIIDHGKNKLFKFIIKADMLGLNDTVKLKKQRKLEMDLEVTIKSDELDGIKKGPIPVKVVVYK
jgi:hypothetical protein